MKAFNQELMYVPAAAGSNPVQEVLQGSRVFIGNLRVSHILFATTALFFAGAMGAFYMSMPSRVVKANTPVAMAAAPASAAHLMGSLEIHIANNGLVLLRSATVEAVDGNTVTLSTSWGAEHMHWTVRTNGSDYEVHHYGTQFLDSAGRPSTVADLHVGGLVTVTGMLDQNASDPTIAANTVRMLQ
jgi:hypothetical protein